MANNKLIVEIVGDSKNLSRTLKGSSDDMKRFSRSVSVSLGSLAKIGGAVAGFAVLSKTLRAGISEFSDQQKAAAQTQAVIKSTGAAAGVTAKQVDSLAAAISNYSGIDDEAIQAGENMLLTFTQIQNTVGKGNDVFNQATRAVADLSVAMGIDATKAALQVGKALNDPARGYARLQRIGVAFTKSQVDAIKGFTKLGQTANAQKVILAELTKEFGGSAAALGQTVPGQLNRLRESFRNLAGSIVGSVAPAFSSALEATNKFVTGLGKAKGVKAKIDFTIDTIKDVGKDLYAKVRESIDGVDWQGAIVGARQQLLEAIRSIGSFLGKVDYGAIGAAIGRGVVAGLNQLTTFIQSVDWSAVGNAIVNGIRAFIAGVNWKAVALGLIKFLVAGVKANVALVKGIGGALGKALLDGIREGLARLGVAAERLALNVVLKIAKAFDFKLLGQSLVPGVDSLVKTIEGKLDDLAVHAKTAGDAVGDAVTKAIGSSNRSAAVPTETTKPTTTPTVVPDPVVTPVVDTKPIETAAEKAKRLFDHLLDGLQLGLEKAQATKPFGDDLKAIAAIIAALRKRASVAKDDLDIQHQLVTALGQQKTIMEAQVQAARDLRSARQFKALGLNAQGGDIVPGEDNLRKQLGTLTSRLASSPIKLSSKLQSQLVGVRKILSGSLGKTTTEVRAKIAELFATIRGEFDKGAKAGPLTKTTSLNATKILEGLGLSPADERTVRARLSQFNSAGIGLGTRPGTSGSFGVAAGRPISLTTTTNLIVDGQKLAANTTKHQQQDFRRNPLQKRG